MLGTEHQTREYKMNDDQTKMLTDAINNLAEAIRELVSRVAEDEPLNYAVARGLVKIAESIEAHQ